MVWRGRGGEVGEVGMMSKLVEGERDVAEGLRFGMGRRELWWW